MSFNVRHAFVISIGSAKKCLPIINELYKENEKVYYELYVKSGMYNDLVKKALPMEDEELVNKLIGIIEHCYKEKSFLKIEKIINKLNPSLLRFYRTSNIVDASKFQLNYLTNKTDVLEEKEIFANLVSLLYISVINNKDFKMNEVTQNFIIGTWQQYLLSTYSNLKKNSLVVNDIDYTNKVKDCYKIFNLEPFEKVKEQSVNLFLENLIEKETMSVFPEEILNTKSLNINEYQERRDQVFQEGIYKYIGCFSRLVGTLGLNSSLCFSTAKVDNDVINVILKDLCLSKSYNNLEDKDAELYVIASLFIYNFIELYKESKEIYLNRSKEEKYRELIEYEQNLKEKEEKISDIIAKNDKVVKSKDDEIRKLKEEIKALKENQKIISSENKELQKENYELNKELDKLNNIEVKKEMDEIESNTEITVEEAIENLKDKKIAIFGGANNIKEIKNILPNIQLYNEINKDISSIRNADLIVINSDFFSHSFTKKINSAVNKYNLEYKYICGTNLNRIILALNNYIN